MDQENKIAKTITLDPAVVAWIARKANRMSAEALEKGEPRVSDSQLVNDILTEAMELDKTKTSPKITTPTTKKNDNRVLEPA